MSNVLTALTKAFAQLNDPAILRVLAKSLAITVLAVVLLGGLAGVFTYRLMIEWGVAGSVSASGLIGALFAILLGWFLFRVIAVAVLQFFADEVVIAVEARHYPEAARQARVLPFREDFSNSLRGIARTLLFNALAMPVALIRVFTAIGPAIVFLLVNAVLLGRELTDMGWLRHREDRTALSPVAPLPRLALGGVVAGMMLVPFVNLLAPIIGAAAGTHMVQRGMRNRHV